MTTQTVEGAIQEAEAGLVNYQEPRIGLAGWVKGLFLDTLRGERKSGTNTQSGAGKVIARAKAKMALELDFRQPYDTNQYLDPRITFSRLSTGNAPGTYFGSDGLLKEAKVNLALQSQTFNTTWAISAGFKAFGSGSTVDATTAPDGTTTADLITEDSTTGVHRIWQSGLTFSAQPCTFSLYVKPNGRSIIALRMNDGVVTFGVGLNTSTLSSVTLLSGETAPTSSSVVSVGNGWYRCSMTVTPAATAGGSVQICGVATNSTNYAGDNASGYYIWGAQLELGSTASQYIPTTSAASAAPRIDFDPVTLECRGLLIEESRANLFTYSQDMSAGWTAGGSTTKFGGQADIAGGTMAAKVTGTGASCYFFQGVSWTSTNIHCVSAYVKPIGATSIAIQSFTQVGQATFSVSGGVISASGVSGICSAQGVTSVGNGWYRIYGVFTANATASNNIGVTAGTFTGDAFLIYGQQDELGSFPTSYIPTTTASLTRAADSCSMQGPVVATNLLLQSNTFNTSWGVTRIATPTNTGAIAPDGNASWNLIEDATASNSHYVYQNVTKAASAVAYVFSVYLKANGRQWVRVGIANNAFSASHSQYVNIATGALGSVVTTTFTAPITTTVTSVGNGWYRIVVGATTDSDTTVKPFIAASDGDNGWVYSGTSTNCAFMYGAQLQTGSEATTYIPTTSAAASYYRDFSGWWNATEGTFVVTHDYNYTPSATQYPAGFAVSDGSTAEAIQTYFTNTSSYVLSVNDNSSTLVTINKIDAVPMKAAVAYKLDDYALCVDGSSVATDTTSTVPTVNMLRLGLNASGSASSAMNGHISRLVYFNKRLPDATLRSLTA